MDIAFDNNNYLEQKQVLSRGQIQSLEILAFTNQELEGYMIDEYLENPLLEHTNDAKSHILESVDKMDRGEERVQHILEDSDHKEYLKKEIQVSPEVEIQELIFNQLKREGFNETEWNIIKLLIHCLDEKGFFKYKTEEIANVFGYSFETIEKCLSILKDLEPIGLFSKDINECLIKQIEALNYKDEKLYLMVKNHMTDILEGRVGKVTKELDLSAEKVREYIHFISQLNPRPIMNHPSHVNAYIVPDVILSREKGRWKAEINDKWMSEYRYNDYYVRLMKETKDIELKEYFQKKHERARFLLRSIEQRRETIKKICESIAVIQSGYFIEGSQLYPMTMKDIAINTGFHVSTVSRAIKGKYIQYKKTVLIKSLFTGKSKTHSGDELGFSVNKTKEMIKELIRNEDRKKPLSDMAIAHKIEQQGIIISRRTVTKYRMQIGIPDSRQRKYYNIK